MATVMGTRQRAGGEKAKWGKNPRERKRTEGRETGVGPTDHIGGRVKR
jgi:hypothetical protein